jgi:hypothetical protein
MSSDFLVNRRQVAGKVETTPGTAETLTAAEATLTAYEPRHADETEIHARKPAAEYRGQIAGVVGRKAASTTFMAHLMGSGAVGTAPALAVYLRACGMAETAVSTIAVGAIAGGPYQAGEIITGGTSGGTGMVVQDTATGAGSVPYIVVTGALQTTELLTGGDSGATSTSSGAPAADKGFCYTPLTTSIPSLTIGIYGDGARRKQTKGDRGSFSMASDVGKPGEITFTFNGANDGESATAMLTSITRETVTPPAFLNANATIAGYGSALFSSFSFEPGNSVSDAGGDANSELGVSNYRIVDDDPRITVNPEASLVATDAFETKLRAGTLARFYCEWPGAAGNDCVFCARKVQVVGKGEGDSEGIETAELSLQIVRESINTDGDRHWFIAFV